MGKKKCKSGRHFSVNIFKLGVLLNALYQTGMVSALQQVMAGNFSGAANAIYQKFNGARQALTTIFATATPAIAYKAVRWAMGPMVLYRGKHFSVNLW